MSYLDRPRLHFAGRFQTTVSTVNNTPKNYDITTFTPAQLRFGDGLGGWNPRGTAIWRVVDCTVRRACYADGTDTTDPTDDPVIGVAVMNADDRVDAKMVDLDPQQQAVSEIWGWRVRLALPGGHAGFAGEYHPAAFTDMWKRYASGPGDTDSVLSAIYQSLIGPLKWAGAGASQLLRELQAASPERLSIKIVVDGFVDDRHQPDFTYGRIVGTIGPAAPHEPAQALIARALRPSLHSPLSYAYCQADEARQRVVIDLGNSIPTTSVGGPPDPAVGAIELAIAQPGTSDFERIGAIDYSEAAYLSSAGVHELSVSPAQLERMRHAPLAVIHTPAGKKPSPLLEENSIAAYLRADQFVFRINPGDDLPAEIVATQYGKAAAHQRIDLALTDALAPEPGDPPTGTPAHALEFPPSVTTDAHGRARFHLRASDPGNPRGYIDGQVYALGYSWHGAPSDYAPNPANFISVRVWQEYPHATPPTWWGDIYPVFKQYANLYPVMAPIVDLSDYHSVLARIDLLKLVFSLSPQDPNAMPTMRDLSRSKRSMILRWLDHPLEGTPPA